MLVKYLRILLFFLLVTACEQVVRSESTPPGTPACVSAKIQELQTNSVTNPPSQVWQYTYRGQLVYYIPPVCCDGYGTLYDANCQIICYPDGGLTGQGDGKCADFFAARTNEKLLWKDNR